MKSQFFYHKVHKEYSQRTQVFVFQLFIFVNFVKPFVSFVVKNTIKSQFRQC